MYFLWAIGALTLITVWITNSLTALPDEGEASSISDAQKMYAYHDAAVETCENTGVCVAELVLPANNVRAQMAPAMQGGIDYNNGKFQSYVTAGGDLITIHQDLNSILLLPVNQEAAANKAAEVSKHVSNLVGYSGIAGSYNQTDGDITNKFDQPYNPPAVIAGDTLADGVPIIAKRRTW